jgi:membrane-associated phospholipid phosphatase
MTTKTAQKIIAKTGLRSRSLSVAVFVALAFSSSSCSKDLTPTEVLPAVTPASADATAGSWKMIVLTGPTQIPVTAPAPTNDPTYVAEIASIKSAQASITDAQNTAITYWSSGGVLRWNEIMRELVARSDLPPEPNPDGSYPVPNPANPFANPQYPFSNPPYAARSYSYVAIAQYEALKVAWYYKFLYNRPSPFKVDSSVKSLLPNSNIPSYPSEDAVEAGVNQALLLLLFPTSADEINAKAAEQQQTAILSGRATPSDIAAGLALGQAVAAIFAARAANDGMKAAGGTPAIWQSLVDTTTARGEIAWISQDGPPRPPMLPLFGQVKAWMLSPTDVINERSGPPPSTSSTQMKTETAEVLNTVNNLSGDQLATVYKWADGVSTPTPSGHWDAIAAPYVSQANYSEVRASRVYALLNMALHDAAVSCWDTKYFYFNPRPSQLNPNIKTQTGLPNFPSYVSGHSMFSAAGADVLSYLFPSGATYFNGQAQEAAMSRLYGGIHYRSDITVGLTQGQRIGEYTVRFAKTDGAN